MIYPLYYLICDNCREQFDQTDESKDYLIVNSVYSGWTYKKVPNGSSWDLCPKCSKKSIEQLN